MLEGKPLSSRQGPDYADHEDPQSFRTVILVDGLLHVSSGSHGPGEESQSEKDQQGKGQKAEAG
jgi:hypothetical protein